MTENAGISGFLKRKNIEFTIKRYGVEALGAMALGLFSSLIVGLILKVLGERTGLEILITYGTSAMAMAGPAIGVAVAFGLKAPPLVLFSSTVTGMAGYQLGGPAGCFVAAVIGAEFGKLVSRETKIDIIITPIMTIITGVAAGTFVGPVIGQLMSSLGVLIMKATELQPVLMGTIVSVLMGMTLTLPISSAALAIMLDLRGIAAGAATVGCSAQMIGFAVASFRENGWGGIVSQGLGTSMLQIPNIVKNPLIWIPPTLAGAIIGPLSTTIFRMENVAAGAGMGTSGLVGQFGTLDAMGFSTTVLLKIGLLHFILPIVLTLAISEFMRGKDLIKLGDMKLHN
ncbi:PTS transporter subunit IIC [Desulfitibacter alkalitolerans]|uniref:PTS transporter subunit IIC n=1 Tax=Desulfitibacter alkalitolerans TaxID=264641 RepID=UPI0004891329|nr:PTS sugar transporter subunit IIC [Desulfitibacter alkalitolerans]